MKTKILLVTLGMIAFAFQGCAPAPTATPYPTYTLYPTYTPIPPTPTFTPVPPTPTPIPPTPTPTLSEQPDQQVFSEYFTEISLGTLPPGVNPGPPAGNPTPMTIFTPNDQFCTSMNIIKDVNVATGIYYPQAMRWIRAKAVFPGVLRAGQSMIGCDGALVSSLVPGKYEYKIWVGDALVAVLPFEVR